MTASLAPTERANGPLFFLKKEVPYATPPFRLDRPRGAPQEGTVTLKVKDS